MLRRFISIILAVMLCSTLTPMVFAAAQPMKIEVESVSVSDDAESADVKISITDNPGIALIGFNVHYDNASMKLSAVSAGEIFTGAADYNLERIPFMYTAYSASGNKTNDGILLTLTFDLNSDISIGTYDITLDAVEVLNIQEENVQCSVTNGSVSVVEKTAEKAISISDLENNQGVSFNINVSYSGTADGIIIAALYSDDKEMVELHSYDVNETVVAKFTKSGSYIKVMWWEKLGSARPLVDVQGQSVE